MTKANDRVAQHICDYLLSASRGKSKFIATIDGNSCIGKSAISKRVAQLSQNKIVILHADYFINPKSEILKYKNNISKDKSFFYKHAWFNKKDLLEAVEKFKKHKHKSGKSKYYQYYSKRYTNKKRRMIRINLSKKILLVEGCFVSHGDALGKIADKKIFLSLDEINIILRRKKRRTAHKIKNIDRNFSRLFYDCYADYQKKEHPEKTSDIHIEMFAISKLC